MLAQFKIDYNQKKESFHECFQMVINFNYKSSLSILWTSSHFYKCNFFCSAVN